jgi:hypothetical protein
MKKLLNFIGTGMLLTFLSASLLTGCASENGKPAKKPVNTRAMGKLNEIFFLGDEAVMQGMVGDTINYYFKAPYLILPQPEPLYDLQFETPQTIINNPYRKEMKVYIIVADLADENSPTTKLVMEDITAAKRMEIKSDGGYSVTVGRNKWAGGQVVIYILGYGEGKLAECVRKNFPGIAQKLNEENRPTLVGNAYQAGENTSIEKELLEKMGVKLKVPGDYLKAIYDEETQTMWLRRDGKKENFNIIIHKLKYTDEEQLTRKGLKKIRNFLGKKFVSTTLDSTYMHINDIDLPMFVDPIMFDSYYTLEARGIWEIVNDYMAGPFMSYLIHNPKTNELLFVDGFVYAPGETKRDMMQELEVILATIDF